MSSHFAAAFFLVKIAIRHIAFKTVELNFVSEGKLKYPGVNSKLFGNNIQVETEDEARNRLLQRIYKKYDAKHLTEYTAELSRYINPEDLLENRDFLYQIKQSTTSIGYDIT